VSERRVEGDKRTDDAATHRSDVLDSIVQVARAVFDARAASITLYDPDGDALVFRAVAGEGSDTLVGTRFSAMEGIAGYVLQSREPIAVEDVERDPRFARDLAESTGYVPQALMAAPLLSRDEAIGVLSVLDRSGDRALGLADMDLLALLARQAAVALVVVQAGRGADAAMSSGDEEVLGRTAAALGRLPRARREAALRLLDALAELVAERPEGSAVRE
jgi:GAF domain-containing protein